MVEGYQRRNRASAVYFRQMYALLFNVNRGEKTPYLEPHEVLRLPGEKKPRAPRANARTKAEWTPEQIRAVLSSKESPTPPQQTP